MPRTRKISELIRSGSGGFARLVATAQRLQSLEKRLAETLQPELVSRVRVAGFEGGVLKLVTPTAAIATRIRLDAADLQRALGACGGPRVVRIETLVAPVPCHEEPRPRKRALSEAARRALEPYMQGETGKGED